MPNLLRLVRTLTCALMLLTAATGRAVAETQEWLDQQITTQVKKVAPDKSTASSPTLTRSTTAKGAVVPDRAPQYSTDSMKLPPMMGFRQLAKSAPMKTMLKELITADVPVMFQTMMMVENGAATGFMGSMNTIGGLLSNTVQTSDLNLKMLDAADPTGRASREYVASAYRSMRFQDGNKGIWPAALFWASGDTLEAQPNENFGRFNKNPNDSGATAADIEPNPSTAVVSATKPILLSEQLFPANGGSNNPNAAEFKTALLKWVGDINTEIEAENGNRWLRKKYTSVAAQADQSNVMGPTNSCVDHPTALETKRCDKQYEVWKHLNAVMRQYCEYKKNNPNDGKFIFKKTKPADSINTEDWAGVQAFDVQVTINFVDQFFKLMQVRKPIEEIDCTSFKGDKDTMPSGIANASSGSSFDSCEGAQAKTCLRNVVLYEVTKKIAESRLITYFEVLWNHSYAAAADKPDTKEMTKFLFCDSLKIGWPCEPGPEFDRQREENRQEWIIFLNNFSKLAQGQGGSSVFRPNSNNLSTFSAGSAGGAKP